MMRIRGTGAAFVAAVAIMLVAVGLGSAPASAGAGDPAATASASSARAALTGSVLGYQCGTGVCLVDPDVPGATPVTVVPDGRFAGVTADGTKVAWVQPGGDLVIAPTTGGAPTTVYTGAVGNQPLMSPDGTRFLWVSPVPIYIGSFAYYYTYRLDVATGVTTGVGACACASSHGFIGATSIGAFPRNGDTEPSRICIIGTEAETGGTRSCGPVQVSEPRGVLSFPDGSSDGQSFVAAMDPSNGEYGGYQGRIALYSSATGALVKDLTTNDTDTTPTMSAEGDRVAFERNDQIMVVDVTTGAERIIGPGVYPSWGGVTARVACTTAGPCRGRASLVAGRKTLAKASYSVSAGRTSAVKLRLTKAGKKAFKGNGRRKLTVVLAGDRTVKKKVTVRF